MTISVAHWDTWDDSVCSRMQGEDIIEHTNVICVHFKQIVDHYVTWTYTS
jgi:hypothetical protein